MKGIVLKTIPYQDTGRIVSLFTDEEGLISLFVKRISNKNTHLQNVLSQLALSEFQIIKRKSDLFIYQDAALIDPFIELRRDLDKLTGAQRMLQILLLSQPGGRPSVPLFNLLSTYLRSLKESLTPMTYALSFACKVLRLEGLFPLAKEEFPYPFNDNEWETLCLLAYATSHEVIASATLPPKVDEKLYSLFSELVSI